MALTKREKLLFPGFLLAFEVIFLILFGLLVRYDDNGGPLIANGSMISQLSSQQNTIKVYPCKPATLFIMHFQVDILSVCVQAFVRACILSNFSALIFLNDHCHFAAIWLYRCYQVLGSPGTIVYHSEHVSLSAESIDSAICCSTVVNHKRGKTSNSRNTCQCS